MSLSYSQFQVYRRCPRQYEYAFVKKLSKGISAGESFGTSVHNALKKWGEREMQQNEKIMENEGQLGLFAPDTVSPGVEHLSSAILLELWHQSFVVEGYESKAAADFARKRGENVMLLFYEWWERQPRHVIAVEKGFSLELGLIGLSSLTVQRSKESDELILTGRLDRVETVDGGVKVIDFKTGDLRTKDEVDADVQLSVYAMACRELFGQPCVELSLLFLSEDGVEEIVTYRNESQLRDAVTQISAVHDRMRSGDFHPDPSVRTCKSCPYRGVCDAAAV